MQGVPQPQSQGPSLGRLLARSASAGPLRTLVAPKVPRGPNSQYQQGPRVQRFVTLVQCAQPGQPHLYQTGRVGASQEEADTLLARFLQLFLPENESFLKLLSLG